MSARPLKLIVFDVDGTLIDSQAHIIGAMQQAFAECDIAAPARSEILACVGLSLDIGMLRLAPQASLAKREQLVTAYKDAFADMRRSLGAQAAPFYPGAYETLMRLAHWPGVVLGVATGKSKRGLDGIIEAHALEGMFVTRQVADFHPSKPHPAMLLAALDETGVSAQDAVMVGDTSFDMDMARDAGTGAIGVSWGYHSAASLTSADLIVDDFAALESALAQPWPLLGVKT